MQQDDDLSGQPLQVVDLSRLETPNPVVHHAEGAQGDPVPVEQGDAQVGSHSFQPGSGPEMGDAWVALQVFHQEGLTRGTDRQVAEGGVDWHLGHRQALTGLEPEAMSIGEGDEGHRRPGQLAGQDDDVLVGGFDTAIENLQLAQGVETLGVIGGSHAGSRRRDV